MNTFCKFLTSLSALIASLAFAWLVLTATHVIPQGKIYIDVDQGGAIELRTQEGGFQILHY